MPQSTLALKLERWDKGLQKGLVQYVGKTIIVLGSEGKGIRKMVLDSCDFQSTIPMQGEINSLNVSAAVSAILFERIRQLEAK